MAGRKQGHGRPDKRLRLSRLLDVAVALSARRFNIPTIVCCETYKFSEKVQLDSICWNEVGDPDELVRPTEQADMRSGPW